MGGHHKLNDKTFILYTSLPSHSAWVKIEKIMYGKYLKQQYMYP